MASYGSIWPSSGQRAGGLHLLPEAGEKVCSLRPGSEREEGANLSGRGEAQPERVQGGYRSRGDRRVRATSGGGVLPATYWLRLWLKAVPPFVSIRLCQP